MSEQQEETKKEYPEDLKSYLDGIAKALDLKKVGPGDWPKLDEMLRTFLRSLEESRTRLPRETVKIDEKGRVVIPDHFRASLGFTAGVLVTCEMYPHDSPNKILIYR